MPVRRQTPIQAVPKHHTYSAPRHDFGIEESLNRADFLSSAALEDTYDAASRSRNKDRDLLRNVNSAIGETKKPWYLERAERARSAALEHTPKTARGTSMPPPPSPQARRARAVSMPPEPQMPLPTANLKSSRRVVPVPRALLLARARSLDRGHGDASSGPVIRRVGSTPTPATTQHLVAHRPARLRKDAALAARARQDPRNPYSAGLRRAASEPRQLDRAHESHHSYLYPEMPHSHKFYHRVPDANERALSRHVYAHRGRYGPDAKPPRPSLASFPQVYVPWNGPGPSNRSKESVFARTPSSGALHASKPPLPKLTERKSIRDVDGFTKPKNVMSWEYRIESRLNPDDFIYEPASLLRMRERVKDVQGKMDRQRQLIDRYLDKDVPPTITSSSRNEGGNPAGGDPDNRPMSDLRRRLRRTLAKSKNNPEYFRE